MTVPSRFIDAHRPSASGGAALLSLLRLSWLTVCALFLLVTAGLSAAYPANINDDLRIENQTLKSEIASRDRRMKVIEEQVRQLLEMFQGIPEKGKQSDTFRDIDQPVRDSSLARTASGSARSWSPSSSSPQPS